MAQAIKSESASITEKLKGLIATAEEWSKKMTDAAKLQNGIFTETHLIATQLQESLEQNIEAAQQLVNKLGSVGDEAARIRAQWQATSGAAVNTMQLMSGINNNPFATTDYISDSSMLTADQKAEFLKIVTDRDKAALETLIAEYKAQINEIYNDEYKSIKAKKEQLDAEQKKLGDRVQELLTSIKGKENTEDYRKTIDLIAKLRQDIGSITQQSGILGQRIGQFDQNAQRIEGQMAVLTRAWDDSTMKQSLDSGARGMESQGYSKDELLWLVNKALETGVGSKFDPVVLTELLKKLESAIPTKKYQLDLTVGNQKLSAFTDLSPEKFIEALLKARGTAI